MRRSKIVSPMHFVWATAQRLPLITPDIEGRVYRCLEAQARDLGCDVLAVGGMPDHVHLAVMFPATVTYADFMQSVKGASSRLLKEVLLPPEAFFYWQDGYGAFGFDRGQITRVVTYITNQKANHTDGKLWPTLKATFTEVAPPPPRGRLAAKPPPSE